jgi:hypothetical protein
MKISFLFVFVLAFLFANRSVCNKKKTGFTEKDVLAPLDAAFNDIHKEFTYQDFQERRSFNSPITYTFLLDLEHGYCETAGSRIHLYADSTRWAIVFEKSGYQNRGGDAEIELDYFGNCYKSEMQQFKDQTYFSNANNIELISGKEYERVRNRRGVKMDTFEFISPDAKEIRVRDKMVPIVHDTAAYAKAGLSLNTPDNLQHLISYGSIVRYLNETTPALIWATEKEIRKDLPADLPKLMVIDTFHFESIYDKHNLPSKNETFQLIAKILAKRDTSLWQPKLKPNNHWSNWTSGNL